jgi:toxin-antitoxin system PIN domain toxin
VILVDVNLLLYAANADSPDHTAAKAWLETRLTGAERVGLSWPTLLAFVRVSSNAKAMPHPISPADAWSFVETHWLARTNVWIPDPTPSHASILKFLFSNFGTTHQKVSDVELATTAIEHGLTLCSADNGFASVPGLQWMNPLRQNSLHERPPLPWLTKTDKPSSLSRRR